jgi:hypothetical protein
MGSLLGGESSASSHRLVIIPPDHFYLNTNDLVVEMEPGDRLDHQMLLTW